MLGLGVINICFSHVLLLFLLSNINELLYTLVALYMPLQLALHFICFKMMKLSCIRDEALKWWSFHVLGIFFFLHDSIRFDSCKRLMKGGHNLSNIWLWNAQVGLTLIIIRSGQCTIKHHNVILTPLMIKDPNVPYHNKVSLVQGNAQQTFYKVMQA